MIRRIRLVLALVLVLPQISIGILMSVFSGPAVPGEIGISPGAGILGLDAAALATTMDTIAASGVGWVRVDLDWSAVESQRGRSDWTDPDRVLSAAAARGLRVLGLLTYAPRWARVDGTTSHAPPVQVGDFARFAGAAAEHYRGRVAAWEVWNEPNSALFWEPRADPERYAALLGAASDAVRRWSSAPVLTGGLAPAASDGLDVAPLDFLESLYAAGAAGAFDGVALHPYTYPALPSDASTAHNPFQQLPAVRALLLRHGDGGLRVWLTEFGAPTGDGAGSVSPERQATILADGLDTAWRMPWVGPVFVYSLQDAGSDAGDREQNFGLLTADGRRKPAWAVLASATARRHR